MLEDAISDFYFSDSSSTTSSVVNGTSTTHSSTTSSTGSHIEGHELLDGANSLLLSTTSSLLNGKSDNRSSGCTATTKKGRGKSHSKNNSTKRGGGACGEEQSSTIDSSALRLLGDLEDGDSNGVKRKNPVGRRRLILSQREKTVRRLESNERERLRMHSLNQAFQVIN